MYNSFILLGVKPHLFSWFIGDEEKVDVLGVCVILPKAPITDEERDQERQYWMRKNSSMFPGLS